MERIIHTRCSPQISILKGGAVEKLEGFAVAAISPEFLSKCQGINLRVTNEFMGMRVGDYGNYDKIFGYYHLGGGKYAFLCTAEREPETVGNRSPRPVFLSEAIVGEFSTSPVRYLNEANFPGFQISQADYYRMDKGSDTKPFDLHPVEESGLIEGMPFEFTYFKTPEKAEALAKLIQYYYEQLALPEEQRTILYLYGPNADILAYIRAIGICLPKSLAPRFTFLSHTSKINNNPERYGYAMVLPTGEMGEYNPFLENPQGKRYPKYMLIGESGSASLPRNARSQFNFFDTVKLTGTVATNPGRFVRALASDESSAREFLAYINENLGGELPRDVDGFYDTYRVLLVKNAPAPDYDSLCSSLSFFLGSNLANNGQIKAEIAAKLPHFYQAHLDRDLGNGLALLSLYDRFDPAIAAMMNGALEARLLTALNAIELNGNVLSLYNTLASANRLGPIEPKMLSAIRGDVFLRLVSVNAPKDRIAFYLSCLKKKAASLTPADFDAIFSAAKIMMVRCCETDLDALRALDTLLVKDPAKRAAAYSRAINEIYPSGKESGMYNLLSLCAGPQSFKDRELTLAKTLVNGNYPYFEKRYARDIVNGDKKEKADTLIALFSVYPAAISNPECGYVYGRAYLDRIPTRGGEEELKACVAYLALLAKQKGALPPKDMIAKIESLVSSALFAGGKNLPTPNDLEALGIKAPARLAALEKALRAERVGQKQEAILFEFAKEPLAISAEDLQTPFLKGIIQILNYPNSTLHLAFFEAFPCQNAPMYAKGYFAVLSEDKKRLDGMALYFSLCIALEEGKNRPSLGLLMRSFEDIMKAPDNDIISTCYDKKFEKTAATLPENTPVLKAAKERLLKDFEAYKKAHQGFFSRLFHH